MFKQGMGMTSYSLEGEDMILGRIFAARPDGYFVDVGAHHPRRFSNTYALYRRGWRGINIDAAPGSMAAFRRSRPRDINIEIGVSDVEGAETFGVFSEPAISRLERHPQNHELDGRWLRKTGSVTIEVARLATILDRHLPPRQTIDLLNVDVERHDLQVLRSNDWARFRPRVILVEEYGKTVEQVIGGATYAFLAERDYLLLGKTVNTCVFICSHSDLIAT